jgi:hypothetical protein
MIPEERFARWFGIGAPLFLLIAIAGAVVIHSGYAVPWRQLLVPISLFVGVQLGAYIAAFWAGKWIRQHGQYGPMPLLGGFYLWGTGLVIMHYGSKWGILPSDVDYFSFSVYMTLSTVIAWLLMAKFGKGLISAISKLNK